MKALSIRPFYFVEHLQLAKVVVILVCSVIIAESINTKCM